MYGVDVAKKRVDDLDRKALSFITEKPGVSVLELGAGSGGMARRMCAAGGVVTAIDVAISTQPGVRTITADIKDVPDILSGECFDLCLFQRTIHYLRYDEALVLLKYLKLTVIGRLCISATGIESDIGREYPAQDVPLCERFTTLPLSEQKVFSISEPLCLYTPEEFMVLLQEAGWEIDECWVSAFGNIKAVCR